MFEHNSNLEIDTETIHNGLERILLNATQYNISCWQAVEEGKTKLAEEFADIRDSYLNAYYLITGINVDYDNLKKEW